MEVTAWPLSLPRPLQEPEQEGELEGTVFKGTGVWEACWTPHTHLGHLIPSTSHGGRRSDPIPQRRKGVSQRRGLDPAGDEFFPLQLTEEDLEWAGHLGWEK